MEELMDSAMHRHDISDHAWSLLAPLLPGRCGAWGGRAKDNRLFVNAIFWILRTSAPWLDLRNMVAGKILIVVFVVGVIKVHGNMSLRIRWICRISGG